MRIGKREKNYYCYEKQLAWTEDKLTDWADPTLFLIGSDVFNNNGNTRGFICNEQPYTCSWGNSFVLFSISSKRDMIVYYLPIKN